MSLENKEEVYNRVGRLYYVSGAANIPAATEQLFLFKTNGAKVDITRVRISGIVGDMQIRVFEGPTVTGEGTPVTNHRYNRRFAASSENQATASLNNGTVTVSDLGTEIDRESIFSDAGGGLVVRGDILESGGAERDLVPGLDYIVAVNNQEVSQAVDISFRIIWIEED